MKQIELVIRTLENSTVVKEEVLSRFDCEDHLTEKEPLHFSGLCIDLIQHQVYKGGLEIALTYTEFEILILLAKHPGKVFSKEKIYDTIWKEPYYGDYNIIMSHIRNIREKIEDDPSKPVYIQTVWGVGYRFNKNVSSGL